MVFIMEALLVLDTREELLIRSLHFMDCENESSPREDRIGFPRSGIPSLLSHWSLLPGTMPGCKWLRGTKKAAGSTAQNIISA